MSIFNIVAYHIITDNLLLVGGFMWEFSLACETKNKYILDYINNCFCGDLPDCMLTSFKDGKYTYLLFASDERIGEICKSKIKHSIITYIIDVYKYDFFKKIIAKNRVNTLMLEAYIKALTLYDIDTDIALINDSFSLDRQFYIDSFLNFKMYDMLRIWKELCDLIVSNINFLNSGMMIDVMKQFIATFNTNTSKLKIIIKKGGFVLYRVDDDQPPIKLKDKAPDIDIINYILLANPKLIEIYGDTTNSFDVINLLKSLYEDKVVLFK